VFIGDSITQYWGMHRPAFFGSDRVNRGIAGQTSAQLLVRFTPDVLALHPRVVHILVGVNDALGKRGAARPEDYRNNIRAMLTLARAEGIAVVLGAIPPADGDGYAAVPGVAARVRELNAWLREEATRRGAVHADYWSVLAGPDGTMRRELSGDGLHPDPSAFALLEPVARNALAEAGRRAALLAPAPAPAQGIVAASHFEKAR